MSNPMSVLLIDDDAEVLDAWRQTLDLEGFSVSAERVASRALARLDRNFPGIVLTDLRMPGLDGFGVLDRVRNIDPEIPVVLVTGHGDVPSAVQAVRGGAWDFIEKPADPSRLVEILRRAGAHRRLILENRLLREKAGGDGLEARLIGRSPAMQRLRSLIAVLADTDVDVLVQGETGTGKELVTRCLHDHGRRAAHPYVAINCGALPEAMIEGELFGYEAGAFTGARERRIGRIEHAHRGTLFLDEIESMPIAAQVRLLRVLQERSVSRLGSNKEIAVDIRVVAGTKRDLRELSTEGRFREDLYYRLNVVMVQVPPLRERREDIPLLFAHFLDQGLRRHGRSHVTAIDEAALIAHGWPGNVRELRNAAERQALGLDLPEPATEVVPAASGVRPLAETLDAAESRAIAAALQVQGGRVGRTAETLGLTRKTLYLKMRKYGLVREDFRDESDVTELDSST